MASAKAFEDLDLSKDEVKRLSEALKDEKFRKLFAEYAEEISDPENRRKAEEEIRMMENERGMNVQFVHPNPGHVLKTTVDGTTKAFINICQNDKIDKPISKREVGPNGKGGLMWRIPHSFAPPRDDVDKTNNKCKVFDVVFHPDTYRMASSNDRFKKLVEDTAIDGVEKQFSVNLDKKNIKHPKINYKGQPVATVIREPIPDSDVKPIDPDSILSKMPYPYSDSTSIQKDKSPGKQGSSKMNKSNAMSVSSNESKFTEPKYTITHSSEVDMSEYRNARDAKMSTRPKQIIIKINLPLLKSASDANLDIFEKKLILESVSPAAYRLDLNLPFPVNEDEGSAKFDKSKKTLTVTLPVLPQNVPEVSFNHHGDGDSLITEDVDGKKTTNNGLITVLSDVNTSEEKTDDSVGDSIDHENNKEKDVLFKFPENVKWMFPDFEISQDTETISLVLKVQCIEDKSVNLSFPDRRSAQIWFMSIGAGCFPSYYRFIIEFCEGCHLSSDHSNMDVSEDNLVLLLLKDKSCRGLWDFYSFGTDKVNMEIKQFLTENNLKRELLSLDEAANKEPSSPVLEEDIPDLSVLEMMSEKVTMEIKPNKNKKGRKKSRSVSEDEDDEYDISDLPSSAEIEVIHRQPTPLLQSILKQRTVSESSEDHSLNADLESPRSGEEDSFSFGKRRSVSFNSHVDRASFKSNASVSSMAPALKSKRKRQKRREERASRGRRCRHNSGTSSGEENIQRSYSSDSHSFSEEDGEGCDKTDLRKIALIRANSDPGPNQACEMGDSAADFTSMESTSSPVPVNATQESRDIDVKEGDSVISDSKSELDFRTKSKTEEMVGIVSENVVKKEEVIKDTKTKNKKIVKEIKEKLGGANTNSDVNTNGNDIAPCDSDDDVDECNRMSSVDDNTEISECDDRVRVNDSKKMINGEAEKEKRDVETALSWNDDAGMNGNEHRTECAFEFSNDIMFTLDVD